MEHFLADQENEDPTGPVSTLPVPSWALFPYRSRTTEVSGIRKEVSVGGAIGVSPDARVPIWNLFRQCYITQGVKSVLPVALRPLGKVWDLAIGGWSKAGRENRKACTMMETSNTTW